MPHQCPPNDEGKTGTASCLPFVIGGALVGHSSLRKSFAVCHEITRAANSSFPVAFRLLAPARRRAMDAIYAYMRVTDDIADEGGELAPAQPAVPEHSGRGVGATADETRRKLAAWR